MSDSTHDDVTAPADAQPETETAKGVTRRRALFILGSVPAAAALGAQQPKPLVPAVTGQSPATPAVAPAAAATGPKFFTAHEWKTVHMLADYIIPKDERSGSASDAKVPEYMDYLLAERDANPAQQTLMHGGLAWLDTQCHDRFGKTFITATDEVLDDIAYPDKARPEMRYGVTFFNRFRDMTASGFFSSSIGWQDVKYIGNVFNPAYDGCPPAALEKLGVSYDLMTTRIPPQAK